MDLSEHRTNLDTIVTHWAGHFDTILTDYQQEIESLGDLATAAGEEQEVKSECESHPYDSTTTTVSETEGSESSLRSSQIAYLHSPILSHASRLANPQRNGNSCLFLKTNFFSVTRGRDGNFVGISEYLLKTFFILKHN